MDLTLIVILLLSTGLYFLVSQTYKFKSRIIKWLSIVTPPLLFLIFAKVPMDIGSSLLYIPFLFTFIWSAIAVIIILIKCILRRGRECTDLCIRSIRPLILISVYFTVQMAHNHSLKAARIFAAEKATLIQDYCIRTSLVPARIEDWPAGREYSGYQSEIYHGSPFASTYPIRYSTHEKRFTIDVRINIDESFTISGGVNEEITVGYGPYFEHQEKKIKKAEELIEFAKTPK